MKTKRDMWQVAGDKRRLVAREAYSCHPSPTRHPEKGIALVITLILLSVTLVMAIAFLAISRRETGSVTTSTDTVTARLAADAALANAQAQIIASVLATTNPYSSGLVVSTNYVNGYGFVPALANPTNVNYQYLAAGGPLANAAQFNQNVANLLYLPRAPVFVPNPTNPAAPSDFRYYLDLNRNGRFDTNGLVGNFDYNGNYLGSDVTEVGDPEWVGVLERPDVPHGPNNKFISRYAFVAVPADGSLDLNFIHNQALHGNAATLMNPPPVGDVFFRNQGVGSWEINLAAFLADLNTNQWDPPTIENPANNFYQYDPPPLAGGNQGAAFEDALALVAYRYNNDYTTLPFASQVLPTNSLPGQVDIFPLGNPLMTGTVAPFYNFNLNNVRFPGADNTNHYFSLASDLFNPNTTASGVSAAQVAAGDDFTGHLLNAGNGASTYDRYTYYRMLAQLGTDSAPAQNQVNLNYANAVAYFDKNGILTNVAYFANAQTNLVPWQPLQFFTIAADRLLKEYSTAWFQSDPTNYLITYYGILPTYYVDGSGFGVTNVQFAGQKLTNQIPSFGITNIPVLENGRFAYTPAVQRVLQLAANIYDATTNQTANYGRDYPSVFRPVLFKSAIGLVTNITIVGFQYISTITPGLYNNPPLDPPDPILGDVYTMKTGFTPSIPTSTTVQYGNVSDIPWIIGAKKGFPNFNEFSMENIVQVTRKLQLTRTFNGSRYTVINTNQNYVMSITNYLGTEFWNSYSNAYTNSVLIAVRDSLSVTLTNNAGYFASVPLFPPVFAPTLFVVNRWPGWTNGDNNANSFMLPLGSSGTNFSILPTAIYRSSSGTFVNPSSGFENYPAAPLSQFGLIITNRLQVFMLDQDVFGNVHVIDYAHFAGPTSSRNLNVELADPDSTGVPAYVWSTNQLGTVPWGVRNQIGVSAGLSTVVTPIDGIPSWSNAGLPPALTGRPGAPQAYFQGFLTPDGSFSFGGKLYFNTNLIMQTPYTPTRTMVEYISWQANDPLVHYIGSDLNYSGLESQSSTPLRTGISVTDWNSQSPPILPDLGHLNERYQPWGRVHNYTGSDNNAWNLAYKDPLMYFSDNWDFPAYKLPTVGWLGRVHRGTPWQTVYLKSTNILAWSTNGANGLATWTNFTGNNNIFDAENSAPVRDHWLFDNFSTALNDNATRGQLSVNMGLNGPSLASWSAVFSGVALPPASPTNTYSIINPAGVYDSTVALTNQPAIVQIVAGINNTRANTNLFPQQVFKHVGDILAVPALSDQSPFLNLTKTNYNNDELYEWLPQQTLSLMRVTGTPQSPMRYVIYSYGQSLRPAPNGVVLVGANLADGTSPLGMVTNYQVVAETATRTVVQVSPMITTNLDGTLNTNYNNKIEQFNVLPPD